jgi:cytochrome c/quinol oxidase subunit I
VPGLRFLSTEQYNQPFTQHGAIMLLLYATPRVFAFANLVLSLQIGSPDVAFPRLNAFSWLFLFGGLTVLSGFLTPGGALDFGWTAYPPYLRPRIPRARRESVDHGAGSRIRAEAHVGGGHPPAPSEITAQTFPTHEAGAGSGFPGALIKPCHDGADRHPSTAGKPATTE